MSKEKKRSFYLKVNPLTLSFELDVTETVKETSSPDQIESHNTDGNMKTIEHQPVVELDHKNRKKKQTG